VVIGVTVVVVLALEEDEPRSTPPVRLALDDANDPTTPRIEPATLLRRLEHADGGEFSAPDGCDPSLTDYGTEAAIADVVAVYEDIGFIERGGPIVVNEQGDLDPDGELIRWIAERPRGGSAWRGVDIAVGGVAGRPGWTTVVELFACSDQGIGASPTT
jgi:hypothetical protein